jgi:ribosome modulation factor
MNMRVCKVAFKQGQEAAANGWERVSPYSKLKAEQYWYNGYDSAVDILKGPRSFNQTVDILKDR